VIPVAVTHPSTDVAFISTSRQSTDQFSLRPADIRPAPMKGGKDNFASPVPVKPAPQPKLDAKITKADVFIHSWKAEIASCPWNRSTRLLRITMQLPADQPAAITPNAYPLQVSFDRRNVREFRRLSERHLPAVELRSAGSQTVWYEFQPVSDDVADTGKSVAVVTLEKGRFTTQTVGPFDSSKLNVQDRGITWQATREDFIFESAVVGLSMLLRGDHQSPGLNHHLVLALAEKGKGTDATGERARFIRQVNEARRAAGLWANCSRRYFNNQIPVWQSIGGALYTPSPYSRPFMANIRSSEKDIRKTIKRTAANQAVKSRIRTLRKKVITAVEKGDVAAANASLSEFTAASDKAAKTKVLHKNTSSRFKSRLALKVGALTKKV